VTITSGMGSIADNTSGGAFAYRSSKAAVNMVMRSLASRSTRHYLRGHQSWLGTRAPRHLVGAVARIPARRAIVAHFSVIVRYAIPDWPC
jgi:NAD(P)-dependent dehydrogenase (short-subunit alcohol dehydrogenase family)